MAFQIPNYLKLGDKIALISTARKISEQEIEPSLNIIQNWGFKPVKGKNLHKVYHQFAGTVQQRSEDLQWALNDPEIKAIICARGGYGTVQLIDGINFDAFRKNPKWICGYSDVTVLHAHIQQNFGIASLHSSMPLNFPKNGLDNEASLTLKKALLGEKLSYQAETHVLNKNGKVNAEIVGGNLSILYALTGTNSQLKTEGKILFLEDLDEYLYHIDRMMQNLKRAGMLQNLAALIIGGMSDMKDNAVAFGKNAEEIIAEVISEYDYPLCFNFPAGHIENNFALKMGANVQLEITNQGSTLSF